MREVGSDLTTAHGLLLRAGLIHNIGTGLFNLLPEGKRVHDTVVRIINEEMEREGVHNLQLAMMHPAELWEKSGRWSKYVTGGTMFQTASSHGNQQRFGMAPTAEEVVTTLVAAHIKTHADLPLVLHQIGTKWRDEVRPRLGLLRCREFGMSDAYSFAVDEQGMNEHFEMMRTIYDRIFRRVGLTNFISVRADSGAIGGEGSAEFMSLSEEIGEDTLITCDSCSYGANEEKATSRYDVPGYASDQKPRRDVPTPGIATVTQLEELFADEGITPAHMMKTLIMVADPNTNDQQIIAVCIRGDLQVNTVKVRNALGADNVVAAGESIVQEATQAEVGFAGPLGLMKIGVVQQILFDKSTEAMVNFLCGFNRTEWHALDVNFGTDVPRPHQFVDLHTAVEGHGCPECEGSLRESKGIEIGHVFKLQQIYTPSMRCTFTNAEGEEQMPWMGCYGIGTTRLVQAIVDQNHDDRGIVWSWELAPYQVVVLPVSWKNDLQREAAERIYEELREAGVRVLLDDRNMRLGEKLTDAELLGHPFRVVVGRKAGEGLFEVRKRGASDDHPANAVVLLEDMLTAWGHGGRDAWKGFITRE